LLAIRSVRRGLAADPRDPQAHLALYGCYLRLGQRTQERLWTNRSPVLRQIRQGQMAGGLQNAPKLQPDVGGTQRNPAEIRRTPADFYANARIYDLAFRHTAEELKYRRNVRAALRKPDEALEQLIEQLEKAVERGEQEIQKQENLFAVRSSGQRTLAKARLALQMGLADKALQTLLESVDVEFGVEGAQLQLKLLLLTGRMDEFHKIFDDPTTPLQGKLGDEQLSTVEQVPAYEWYSFLAAMAEGNYRKADQMLEEINKQMSDRQSAELGDQRQTGAGLVGEVLLDMPQDMPLPGAVVVRLLEELRRQKFYSFGVQLAQAQAEKANRTALRGLVALEVGDTERARSFFSEALLAGLPPERYTPFLGVVG